MTPARGGAAAALAVLLLGTAVIAPADPAADRVHTVVKGDTLGALARRYGVPVRALVAANRLPDDRVRLRLGQRLVIPAAGTAPARLAAPRTTLGTGPRARGPRAPVDLVLAVPDFADELGVFLWPADGTVTSPFGRRRSGWHRGIDIRADPGEPVLAAAAGVVVISAVEPRYGRVIKVEHEHGFTTVYAHNAANLVEVGDWVTPGQRIGSVGRTGRATNHHVHFEIRRDGRVYNPLYLLPMPSRVAHVDESQDEEPDE